MLGDLDGDQILEVCGVHSLGGGSPNRLSCLDRQGSVLFTFDVLPGDFIHSQHFGDIDANGAPETFFFSYVSGYQQARHPGVLTALLDLSLLSIIVTRGARDSATEARRWA